MSTATSPADTDFLFDRAIEALDDQMRWIDALDTKSGVLMASDGLIAGLVLTRGSILLAAPVWVGILVALLLFISLVFALLSFSTRRFEIAPDIVTLASESWEQSALPLRAQVLPDIIYALRVNEQKVGQKANLLFVGGTTLMLSVAVFTGYFLADLMRLHS